MLNLKKSLIFFLATVLVLVSSGFGCKGQTAEEKAAMKLITLEYWTVFDDVNGIRALVDEYRQLRPYLNVNIRQLRSDEIYSRLLEALAEDKGPDIISVSNRSINKYLPKLQPMPATVKDTLVRIEEGKFSDTTHVNIQTRNLLSPVQLEKEYVRAVSKDAVKNGKIYGLPLSTDVMALYYNKDLLDRAGIPQPPKDWEEFQESVKKLTKFQRSSGKITQAGAAMGTGANIPGSSDIFYVLFAQSNLNFVDSKGSAVFSRVANDGREAPAFSVLNFYTDFANSARDTYTWNETMPNALESFVNGSLAFFFGYNYHYATIKGRAPQLNFDVLPLPQLSPDSKVNTANYWLQTVTAKSKHPNEAWALIDFLAHSPSTKKYLDQTGRPTALRLYITAQREKPELAPFAEQVLNAENWYYGKDYDAANKAIQDMFAEWLKDRPSDVDERAWRQTILERAAQKFNQTL